MASALRSARKKYDVYQLIDDSFHSQNLAHYNRTPDEVLLPGPLKFGILIGYACPK